MQLGRQAQGSQPVRVRSEETPESSVVGLPASVERPVSKWSDNRPLWGCATGRSATSREACSVVSTDPRERGQGGAEPVP